MRQELERLLKESNEIYDKISGKNTIYNHTEYWQGKIDALNEAIDIFDNQDCSDSANTINEEMKKFTQGFSYKPPT